jgi:Heparinase II/III-like protein
MSKKPPEKPVFRSKHVFRPINPGVSSYKKRSRWLIGAVLLWAAGVAAAAPWKDLADAEIQRIESQLPAQPQGFGPACTRRADWQAPGVQARIAAFVPLAEKLLGQPFPAWRDDDYRRYSQTGSRAEGERMMIARKAWLYPLVMAECAEGRGRFMPAISTTLRELATQPSWTWPAHDRGLRNFEKQDYEVDLSAADLGHDLAQALYLLGDWLPAAERARVMRALDERIFAPLRKTLAGGGGHSWLRADHNWNAVCLKGVVGAALAVLHSRADRAVFAAAASHYIDHYLGGFPADGYSTEGPSYWNYGFSHFAVLRELLVSATGGQLDLFSRGKVDAIARYGLRFEMRPGNAAPFGDAGSRQRPDPFTLAYLNDALGWRLPQRVKDWPIGRSSPGNASPLALFVSPARAAHGEAAEAPGLSSFFPDAGVLVSRAATPEGRLAVSIKAGGRGPGGGPGGNGNHSHNDIGSYAIALGEQQPAGDVGAPRYSAKTFSKERYTIRAINSYGHPVPVVAGQLQQDATRLIARVLKIVQSAARDDITIDLAPAYAVAALKTFTRSLTHLRATPGQAAEIRIEDRFEFTSADL